MRMSSPIEDKILEIIFKDKLVTNILVDTLLPKVFFTTDIREDLTVEEIYNIARDNLKTNLNKLLGTKP